MSKGLGIVIDLRYSVIPTIKQTGAILIKLVLIWNLYPNGELTEGDKSKLMGTNYFGTIGYKEPCKIMTQTKKFQITLYALDILSIPLINSKTKKKDLLSAMSTHIIEKTEMFVYL